MKKIEAIIRPERLPYLKAALEEMGYPGMTIAEVKGHGNQRGITEQWRGRQFKVDFLPKTYVLLIVDDSHAEQVVTAICENAGTGEIGDGKIFISTIDDVVRVRTRERGTTAI